MGEGQVCLPGRRPLETGPSKLFRSTLWPDRQRRRQVSGPKTHRSCLPIKMKCCPKADARKITRADHEDDRQVARDIAKTKQYAISMRLRCSSHSATASLGWDDCDCAGHTVQMTNFSSLQSTKTSASWPRPFRHRSTREKPDSKGARALFKG